MSGGRSPAEKWTEANPYHPLPGPVLTSKFRGKFRAYLREAFNPERSAGKWKKRRIRSPARNNEEAIPKSIQQNGVLHSARPAFRSAHYHLQQQAGHHCLCASREAWAALLCFRCEITLPGYPASLNRPHQRKDIGTIFRAPTSSRRAKAKSFDTRVSTAHSRGTNAQCLEPCPASNSTPSKLQFLFLGGQMYSLSWESKLNSCLIKSFQNL